MDFHFLKSLYKCEISNLILIVCSVSQNTEGGVILFLMSLSRSEQMEKGER